MAPKCCKEIIHVKGKKEENVIRARAHTHTLTQIYTTLY